METHISSIHLMTWTRLVLMGPALRRAGIGTMWTTKIHSSLYYFMILPGYNIYYAIRSACFSQLSVKIIS